MGPSSRPTLQASSTPGGMPQGALSGLVAFRKLNSQIYSLSKESSDEGWEFSSMA